MEIIRIEKESKVRLRLPVTADDDPTDNASAWAFVVDPARPTSFTAGSWLATPGVQLTTTPVRWRGVALTPLIGPGGVVLNAGVYFAYIQITAGLEVVVMLAGKIRVVG